MKILAHIAFGILLFASFTAKAQQRPLSSLSMFNLFDANSAYSGNAEAVALAARYRAQWLGFEGAPTGQSVSIHAPIAYPKLGAGLKVYRETIGAREQLQANAAISYHFAINKGKVALALQGGIRQDKIDINSLTLAEPNADFSSQGNRSTIVPLFDFAFLYTTDMGYIGIQLNQFLTGGSPLPSGDFPLVAHFDVMAGKIFEFPTKKLHIRPATFVRWDSKTTPQIDLNVSALYNEKIWLGVGYRTGFGMLFSLEYNITRYFRLGYAYDLNTGAKAVGGSGSHEVFLGYNIPKRSKKLPSIRFF